MAVAIDSSGAMVGLWRDHKAGSRDIKHSVVHLVTASNWSDPGTYMWDQEDLFFGQNSETAKRKKTFLEGIADGEQARSAGAINATVCVCWGEGGLMAALTLATFCLVHLW